MAFSGALCRPTRGLDELEERAVEVFVSGAL